MTPCLILDVTDAMDQAPYRPQGCEVIPAEKRPTILQPNRATAEREALRLAKLNPGRRFAIFEACAMSLSVDVPTHVSLDGKVLISGKQPALVLIDQRDEVPF